MELALNSESLNRAFLRVFPESGDDAAILEVQAPGRVNLIGEHTDYNDGFVFPMAIDRVTAIALRRRGDQLIRLYSTAQRQMAEFSIGGPVKKDPPAWSLYAKGVCEALRQKGHTGLGADILVESDIPLGGGLSSSAAFEVATALALLSAWGQTMPPVEMALACQWAEHHYAGTPCGIMDQFISAMAKAGHAMLLDCRDQSYRQIPLDDPTVCVVIVNSHVKHELVAGEYKDRRSQCQAAVAALAKMYPLAKALRDVTMPMLQEGQPSMDPVVFKRARHVVGENQRALDFAAALQKRDYAACGRLMYASHASLRDDYAVSCPELDTLVDLSRSISGVFGARLTGGGFGGCVVVLAKKEAIAPLTQVLEREYPLRCGKNPGIFATAPGPGAHVVRG
jgi:galactokinase